MDQRNIVIWNIPFYFFIFLGFFLTLKFVFIFFFRAAFEPRFIFELTPFYFLSGMNNLQLIFLSLLVVGSDMYFHINLTRKNLYRSFIPTSCMLAGLGLGITTKAISISNLPQYLIFGLLLFILIIDHRRTLIFPGTLPEKIPTKLQFFPKKIPLPFLARPKPQQSLQAGRPTDSSSGINSFFNIFKRGNKITKTDGVSVSSISSVLGLFKRGNKVTKTDGVSVSSISSVLGLFKRGKKTAKAATATDDKEKKAEPIEKTSGKDKIVQGKPTQEEPSEKNIIEKSSITPGEKKEKDTQLESQSESINLQEEDKMPPEFDKWKKEQREIKKEQDILIKDLQSNFEEIKKGFEYIKNELENISKKQQSTPKFNIPRKIEEKRKFDDRFLKKITPPSYSTSPEKKIPSHLNRQIYDGRKRNLLRAQKMLADIEKKVVKLEQPFNR